MPTAILDIDLADGYEPIAALERYESAFVLIRWQHQPVGTVRAPVRSGSLREDDLLKAAAPLRHDLMRAAAAARLRVAQSVDERPLPSVSVVICTRNRASELRNCLDSLRPVAASAEIIVVDNAPPNDATRTLVNEYPGVRYEMEPRAGLCFARQRGIRRASSEVVAFVDDDAVVDAGWLESLRASFRNSATAAVTGKVLPVELETEAQEIFEFRYGGFGRGFEERDISATRLHPLGAGGAGAGANMAFRRELAIELGLFEPHLDSGTPAESGGETYAFYRLLVLGHRIRYVPSAIVWHRHRREMSELRRQLRGYSTGVYTFWLRCLLVHGDLDAISAMLVWLHGHHLTGLRRALRRGANALPVGLVLAQLDGCARAPLAYARCRLSEHRDALLSRPRGVA